MNVLGFAGHIATTTEHVQATMCRQPCTIEKWSNVWLCSHKTLFMDPENWILYNFDIVWTYGSFDFSSHLKPYKPFLSHASYKNRRWSIFGPWAIVHQLHCLTEVLDSKFNVKSGQSIINDEIITATQQNVAFFFCFWFIIIKVLS